MDITNPAAGIPAIQVSPPQANDIAMDMGNFGGDHA